MKSEITVRPRLRVFGPRIFANRKIQVWKPNRCWNAPIMASHESLVAPYSEMGFGNGKSSAIGCFSGIP